MYIPFNPFGDVSSSSQDCSATSGRQKLAAAETDDADITQRSVRWSINHRPRTLTRIFDNRDRSTINDLANATMSTIPP